MGPQGTERDHKGPRFMKETNISRRMMIKHKATRRDGPPWGAGGNAIIYIFPFLPEILANAMQGFSDRNLQNYE